MREVATLRTPLLFRREFQKVGEQGEDLIKRPRAQLDVLEHDCSQVLQVLEPPIRLQQARLLLQPLYQLSFAEAPCAACLHRALHARLQAGCARLQALHFGQVHRLLSSCHQ